MSTFALTFKPPGSTQSAIESPTCADSATFALQVLDSSMEPEFAKGCIIVIDPSIKIKIGSFVLASIGDDKPLEEPDTEQALLFRQVCQMEVSSVQLKSLQALSDDHSLWVSRKQLVGVIVQRAGVRRSYAKNYA